MDWQSGRRSDNVEDRRGGVGRGVTLSGGAVVLIVVVGALLGKSPSEMLRLVNQSQRQAPGVSARPRGSAPANDVGKDFVRSVLGSTEDVWDELFLQQGGAAYRRPKLVLFRDGVDSACGFNESAVGPFYCSGDEKVYLDLDFFDELDRRFHAPGEFARAYVIAHEIGHHVQNVLGLQRRTGARSRTERNAVSVRTELQADCLAGVWAFHAQKQRPFLERGDLESALGAASAIGDDRLQRQARGYVVPESFTHGSSAQRVKWFRVGFQQGSVKACDTFTGEGP